MFLIPFFVSMRTAKSANQNSNSQHEIMKDRIWFRLFFRSGEIDFFNNKETQQLYVIYPKHPDANL